jgi:hypothetical protein
MRLGKTAEASTSLEMARKERNLDDDPPVVELLLALNDIKRNQRDAAKARVQEASRWLARYDAVPSASLIGRALNPWALSLPAVPRDTFDPRARWRDWESWHEAEQLLLEVQVKLAEPVGVQP